MDPPASKGRCVFQIMNHHSFLAFSPTEKVNRSGCPVEVTFLPYTNLRFRLRAFVFGGDYETVDVFIIENST